jgi:hypothetical protein
VTAIALDGHYVFTGSEDGTTRMWNGATGVLHHELLYDGAAAPGDVECISVVPESGNVLVGTRDGFVIVYDQATGRAVRAAVATGGGTNVKRARRSSHGRRYDAATAAPATSSGVEVSAIVHDTASTDIICGLGVGAVLRVADAALEAVRTVPNPATAAPPEGSGGATSDGVSSDDVPAYDVGQGAPSAGATAAAKRYAKLLRA